MLTFHRSHRKNLIEGLLKDSCQLIITSSLNSPTNFKRRAKNIFFKYREKDCKTKQCFCNTDEAAPSSYQNAERLSIINSLFCKHTGLIWTQISLTKSGLAWAHGLLVFPQHPSQHGRWCSSPVNNRNTTLNQQSAWQKILNFNLCSAGDSHIRFGTTYRNTCSLSSWLVWVLERCRNSCVSLKQCFTCSGETKSSATLIQLYRLCTWQNQDEEISICVASRGVWYVSSMIIS